MKTYFERYLKARLKNEDFRNQFTQSYEQQMKDQQCVFLVGWEDVESYVVKHVCASEALAKERFEEVRQSLLNSAIKSKESMIKKGRSPDVYDAQITLLEGISFENRDKIVNNAFCETPFCDCYVLEQ